MTFIHRLEQANNQPDDDRPLDVVIADLIRERDALQAENVRLQQAIRAVEREGVERKYWHNCYEPRADGRYER